MGAQLHTHIHTVLHMNAQCAHKARLASVIEMLSPGYKAVDGNAAQHSLLPSGSAQSTTARGTLPPQTHRSSCRSLSFPLVATTHTLCAPGEGYCILLTVQKFICFKPHQLGQRLLGSELSCRSLQFIPIFSKYQLVVSEMTFFGLAQEMQISTFHVSTLKYQNQ